MTHIDSQKVLVIGDLIIDTTFYVNTDKISPEAPVVVASLTGPSKQTIGGAGLGASYAEKYNVPYIYLSTISENNTILLNYCNIKYINTDEQRREYNNVEKIRYIDIDSGYHLIRIDNDSIVLNDNSIVSISSEQLIETVKKYNIGCISILDYQKGLLTESNISKIKGISELFNIPIYSDTRGDATLYKNINTLKLNKKEFNILSKQIGLTDPFEIVDKLNLKDGLIISLAGDGAEIYTSEHKFSHKTTKEYNGAPDVTGCGDVLDINFCYNKYILKESTKLSLIRSVEKATQFAYSDIKTRLQCLR